jgi:hypothetical protein
MTSQNNTTDQGENGFYLGNTKLPTDKTEYEWSPEMVSSLKKCKKNILHFAEKFFYIVNLDRGRDRIRLYPCQKKVLRKLRDNRFNIVLSSRQSGKTTMMTIYALWICCFYDDQRILIVANKEQTAGNIFKRIRLAYELLPNYLKPGVTEYGKTSMTLTNGSSIGISTTSSDAGRGDSCNVLILDELAFIPDNLVEEFWRSVYPIISSSKTSKIFIASTPNGTGNLFHSLYSNAIQGKNNWTASRIDWWELPSRDEKWKIDTIQSLGSREAFSQEFENEFIETGETVLNDEVLNKLLIGCMEPQFIFDDGSYKIWKEPDPKNRIYVAGVDISEGVGQDASVIQILDITDPVDIEQVAIYHNNEINPYNFTNKLYEILQNWGSPLALIERNSCGIQVVDNLFNINGYQNIITYNESASRMKYERRGVVAHTNSKYKGVTNMRYWISEARTVTIRDKATIEELKCFVRHTNGKWSAKKGDGMHDDRTMSLVWALFILEQSLLEKHFEILETDIHNKPTSIAPLDYGLGEFVNPLSLYANEADDSAGSITPFVFGNDSFTDDISQLQQQGWEFPINK